MGQPSKRKIDLIENWEAFLEEGKEEFQEFYDSPAERKYERKDFVFFSIIGFGAFGHVYLAELQKTREKYAIKMMEKRNIVKAKQVNNILEEKKVLQAINFPFCVHVEMSFQTPHFIYLCLPYLPGGDMLKNLWQKKKYDEDNSKFYSSQVLLALEYLHYLNIVHRDVKPENIVMNSDGYVKLSDFGFCKVVREDRSYTFCGTPEYAAPEIVLQRGYGKSVDWWSFGVFLYELSAGYPPFQASNNLKIFEKVVSGKYIMPDFFSPALTDLIKNLIQVDLTRRYGNLKKGVDDIKYHPWFSSISWMAIINRSVPAPHLPLVREVKNCQCLKDIGDDLKRKDPLVDKHAKEFADF